MQINNFKIINILDLACNKNNLVLLNNLIANFKCSKNKDFETFLKESAIDFSSKKQSITYLIFSRSTKHFVGYFTLIVKPLLICMDNSLSKRDLSRINRSCQFDINQNAYITSAYLIAQLGKNDVYKNEIEGYEILECIYSILLNVQKHVGGNIMFLESILEPKVITFYHKNLFREFSIINNKNEKKYQPMIKTF